MIRTNYVIAKDALLGWISRLVARAGLLPILLSIADRWGIKRKTDHRLALPFVARRKYSHFQILSYHRVNDEQNPFFGGVSVKVFARQMEMLCKYFSVLPLEELVERMEKNDVPPNAIAITFDDGYRDNYENGFPVLRQFGLPATIFLVTGAVDSKNGLWHDHVFDAFLRTNARSVSIGGKEFPLRTPSEKFTAVNVFRRYLRRYTFHDWADHIQKLTDKLAVPEQYCVGAEKLRWQEIEEMSKDHITFGAHTVSHPILTRMPLSEAIDEIIGSKEIIEKRLGLPVRLFAYPNGSRDDFNVAIKQVLKENGFVGAATTLWGTNDVHTDPFELRRMGIGDLDPRMSALKLGWYKFFS